MTKAATVSGLARGPAQILAGSGTITLAMMKVMKATPNKTPTEKRSRLRTYSSQPSQTRHKIDDSSSAFLHCADRFRCTVFTYRTSAFLEIELKKTSKGGKLIAHYKEANSK